MMWSLQIQSHLDVSSVVTSISGPKRPQDKVLLTEAASSLQKFIKKIQKGQRLLSQMSLEKILN